MLLTSNDLYFIDLRQRQSQNNMKYEYERAYTNQIHDELKIKRLQHAKVKRPQTGNLSLKSRNYNIGGSYHKTYLFNNNAWSNKDRYLQIY